MAAMSGGVDSSVAAAILKEAGHEVVGVTMKLFGEESENDPAIAAAREVCLLLGIEHKVLDVRETFRSEVIESYVDDYVRGQTPNPCVRCNEKVKFGVLLKLMDLLRAERLATGHYARVLLDGKSGRYILKKGLDEFKDQSYFLYRLRQDQLGLSLFPLGEMTKEEVRDKARAIGLPNAERMASQEACFVNGDYRDFIKETRPESEAEGEFVDVAGAVMGRHEGVAFYTVGQRKGLGVSSPLGRRYVLERDPATRRIVLGDMEDLKSHGCLVGAPNFISIDELHGPRLVDVKLRYRAASVPSTIEPYAGGVSVLFHRPVYGIAPGQSAVFYEGNTVVGGGIIMKKVRLTID